jgi:hypothetical protein
MKNITKLLCFTIGTLLFTYLGVPIFKWISKYVNTHNVNVLLACLSFERFEKLIKTFIKIRDTEKRKLVTIALKKALQDI